MPHLASKLTPLYSLLQKAMHFPWRKAQDKAFKEAKGLLTSHTLLVHFDGNRELVLSCDATLSGLGAVLSRQAPDGTDQPVAFTSHTSEQRYAHLDKEGLAI